MRWWICECRVVSVVARMRCVELVADWIIGDVGAVYGGGDSKERELCGSSKGLIGVSKISR